MKLKNVAVVFCSIAAKLGDAVKEYPQTTALFEAHGRVFDLERYLAGYGVDRPNLIGQIAYQKVRVRCYRY